MKEVVIKTAYGDSVVANKDDKRFLLSRISDAMSIRNTKYHQFTKELDVLLTKYNL